MGMILKEPFVNQTSLRKLQAGLVAFNGLVLMTFGVFSLLLVYADKVYSVYETREYHRDSLIFWGTSVLLVILFAFSVFTAIRLFKQKHWSQQLLMITVLLQTVGFAFLAFFYQLDTICLAGILFSFLTDTIILILALKGLLARGS